MTPKQRKAVKKIFIRRFVFIARLYAESAVDDPDGIREFLENEPSLVRSAIAERLSHHADELLAELEALEVTP